LTLQILSIVIAGVVEKSSRERDDCLLSFYSEKMRSKKIFLVPGVPRYSTLVLFVVFVVVVVVVVGAFISFQVLSAPFKISKPISFEIYGVGNNTRYLTPSLCYLVYFMYNAYCTV
jgi:hypothetical protein